MKCDKNGRFWYSSFTNLDYTWQKNFVISTLWYSEWPKSKIQKIREIEWWMINMNLLRRKNFREIESCVQLAACIEVDFTKNSWNWVVRVCKNISSIHIMEMRPAEHKISIFTEQQNFFREINVFSSELISRKSLLQYFFLL